MTKLFLFVRIAKCPFTSKNYDGKTDTADAVEFSFEFQNGEKCEIEMDGVCDGSVSDSDVDGVQFDW